MKLMFSYPFGVLNLPDHITPLLAKADKLSLCALLYFAKHPDCDTATLCAIMRADGVLCSEIQLQRAVHFWQQNGVLRDKDDPITAPAAVQKKVTELPVYDSDELAEKLTEGESRLGQLVDECQKMAGKMFTPTDLSRLVSLVDYLALSCDYVKRLYAYCIAKERRNIGYLQKAAQNLYDEGVRTEDDLAAYLEAKTKSETLEGKLRTLFGLGERSLSTKEKGFVAAWVEADYAQELLQLAYDITVDATGKVAFAYMDKILQKWKAAGITTAKDAKEAQNAHAAKTAPIKENGKSFEADDFFAAALQRSYQKSKDEGGQA